MGKYKELYEELGVKRYRVIHTPVRHETGFYLEGEEYDLPLDVADDFMEHLQLVIPPEKKPAVPPIPTRIPEPVKNLQIDNKKEK